MRRLLAGLLVLVGIILIVIGFGSGTWWKPSETVTASTQSDSKAGMVMTDPGVLELVNDDVSVVARANGHNVAMVVARTSVIDTWLSNRPVERISGLESWTVLASSTTDGTPEPTSFMDSDLFNPENLIEGKDAVQLHFTVPEGDWSILAVSDGGVTPQIELTWNRSVTTPWMIPLMIAGLLLAATGAAIALHDSQSRSLADQRAKATERAKRKETADVTETTTIPAVSADKADKTEKDERVASGEETGGAYGAGIVPAAPDAEQIRAERDEQIGEDDTPSDPSAVEDHGEEPSDQGESLDEVDDDTEPALDDTHESEDDPQLEPVQRETEEPEAEHEAETEPVNETHDGDIDDEELTEAETDSEVEAELESDTADAKKTTGMSDWRALWGFGSKEN